jgi:hypothetical protein
MNQPTFTKSYKAGATINKNRIVCFGADDAHVIQGAAATDALIGVVDIPGPAGSTSVAEERVDVIRGGEADIEAGGTITRGAPITADSVGRAVAAAPAAGVNNRIIGFAMNSAVSGDIFPAMIQPGVMQGA